MVLPKYVKYFDMAIRANKCISLYAMQIYKDEYHYMMNLLESIWLPYDYYMDILFQLKTDLDEKRPSTYLRDKLTDNYMTTRFNKVTHFFHFHRFQDADYPEIPIMFREAAFFDFVERCNSDKNFYYNIYGSTNQKS